MSRFGKRVGLLLLSFGLIVAIAVAGVAAMWSANSRTEQVLLSNRLDKTTTLAGLTNQFFQFEFNGMLSVATDRNLSLRPGDPGDHEKLRRFVEGSALIDHGAALVGFDGTLLNAFGATLAFPAADDPGLAPLIDALQRGKPGLSSVMNIGETSVVALGLPVPPTADARAIFLAMFRADTSPLQQYNEQLRYGRRGTGYVVDTDGAIGSATNTELVGTHVGAQHLAVLRRGGRGTEIVHHKGEESRVAAFAPIGIGGWTILNEEPEADFFEAVRTGSRRTTIALLALLVVAAASLTVLNAKRHRALSRAYEYKGELLANTTHELKTPLTAIRGAAMTLGLRRNDMSEEQIDMFLGMIHRRTEALQKLVDRILTGARLEAGREVPIALQPVDVGDILARNAAEFVDASPRHQIETSSPPGIRVSADPFALDQVLGLLLENAIKYSPDGGVIRLEATAGDQSVHFRVADGGVGVSEEDLPHVFEAYFKATRGDRQTFPGVGLGLSIAKHLVERHGGKISVVSTPGAGTVFSFSLPALAPIETPSEVTV